MNAYEQKFHIAICYLHLSTAHMSMNLELVVVPKPPTDPYQDVTGTIQVPLGTIQKPLGTPAIVVLRGPLQHVKSLETSKRCRTV